MGMAVAQCCFGGQESFRTLETLPHSEDSRGIIPFGAGDTFQPELDYLKVRSIQRYIRPRFNHGSPDQPYFLCNLWPRAGVRKERGSAVSLLAQYDRFCLV